MVRLERVWKMTSPEEAEETDREFYRRLSPNERVSHLLEIINAWTNAPQRRLERTYRFISVPRRWISRGRCARAGVSRQAEFTEDEQETWMIWTGYAKASVTHLSTACHG